VVSETTAVAKGYREMDFAGKIRVVMDFPRPGIVFRDITTLLKDAEAFRSVVDDIVLKFRGNGIDTVVAIESRGFILGGAVAYQLKSGFVPVRKLGKLPYETIQASYDLEYGSSAVELHKDAILPGQRVLLIDDLLATGGTMQAAASLVQQLGGEVSAIVFLIELDDLRGRQRLSGYNVVSLVHF
jgi:adenine phosphoribosyltransferase